MNERDTYEVHQYWNCSIWNTAAFKLFGHEVCPFLFCTIITVCPDRLIFLRFHRSCWTWNDGAVSVCMIIVTICFVGCTRLMVDLILFFCYVGSLSVVYTKQNCKRFIANHSLMNLVTLSWYPCYIAGPNVRFFFEYSYVLSKWTNEVVSRHRASYTICCTSKCMTTQL